MTFLHLVQKSENLILMRAVRTRSCYITCLNEIHGTVKNNTWKILFFGTDDFSLVSLKTLHKQTPNLLSRLEVVSANNTCDVVKYANDHGITINNWPLKNNPDNFDIGIAVSFGHLIPRDIIHAFPLGMINVHGSLLPRWRGSCPINYALIKGDEETGVTIMKIMPDKFDTGDIVAQNNLKISPHETVLELRRKLAQCGANLLLDVIKELPEILKSAKPQSNTGVTYAYKIKPALSTIKWTKMSAQDIYNLQRGLMNMFPPKATLEDKQIKLLDISVYENSSFTEQYTDDEPGTAVYDKKGQKLLIKCKGNTWISVSKVIVEKKHATLASSFCSTYLSARHRKKLLLS